MALAEGFMLMQHDSAPGETALVQRVSFDEFWSSQGWTEFNPDDPKQVKAVEKAQAKKEGEG